MSDALVDGRFRIGPVIGRGNMEEAHRAEDLQAPEGTPERAVAVKTILRRRTGTQVDTAGDAKAVQRFFREVRIMRRLLHPNLTRLVAGGNDENAGSPGGLPYLAMEFLDGKPLRDLIEEEAQLPVSWAAAIGAQTVVGLATAHAAGIVHRGLKPANVMLTQGGHGQGARLRHGQHRRRPGPDPADQHGRERGYRPLHGTRAVPGQASDAGRRPLRAGLCAVRDAGRRSAVHQRVRLYGVSRDDTSYVLDTFNVTRDINMKAYGTYRTKDLVLAQYDRMAQAGLTLGNPLVDSENYTSTLTPPPGHGPRHEGAGE